MSGPIVPPLEVSDEADGGSVSGRPITTIEVTDGTLTVSGRTATIDTSGSGASPATPADAIQFNSDPAGTFTADAGFTMNNIGGGNTTIVKIGGFLFGGNTYGVVSDVLNGSVTVAAEGTGQIFLQGTGDAGGTWSDTIANVMCWDDADDATLRFKNNNGTAKQADITLDGSLDLIIDNSYAGGGNIELLPGTGKYVKIGGGAATGTLTSNGAFDLQLSTNSGTNSGTITIEDGVNGTIELVPNGTGLVKVSNLNVAGNYALPTAVTTDNDYVLTAQTDGSTAWAATATPSAPEGTAILSTGETGATKFLREDGDGTCSWQEAGGGVSGLTGLVYLDNMFLGEDPSATILSSADDNVAYGDGAMPVCESNDRCTAIGSLSGNALTTGNNNTLIGYRTGTTLTTFGDNTCVGANSGRMLDDSSLNTYLGSEAGSQAAGVHSHTLAAGYFAGYYKGSYNVILGSGAMSNTASSDNQNCVAVGYEALKGNIGDNNIAIGSGAGEVGITGTGNVMVGKASYVDSVTGNDQLSISGGDAAVYWIKGDSAGACYQGDNASTWSTTSDSRLKREIVDAPTALNEINRVRVRNFRFIEKAKPILDEQVIIEADGTENRFDAVVGYDGENRYNLDPEPLRVGVIAQELQKVFPDAVKENAHGHLTVNTDSINWALLRAVQELSAKVEALEANQ